MPETYEVAVKSRLPGRLRLQDASGGSNLPGALGILLQDGIIASYQTSRINGSALVFYDPARLSTERILEALHGALAAPRRAAPQENHHNELSIRLEQTSWEVRSDTPGRIRLRHPAVGHCTRIAQKIELALVNLDGVTDYRVNGLTSTVLVRYDIASLQQADLVEELAVAVREGLRSGPLQPDNSLKQFALSTTALALASTAGFLPALMPIALVSTAIVSGPIFASAFKALFIEKKIKVDILDAIVIALSLGFGHVIAGAIMVWIVDASNLMLTSSSGESRKLLTKVFGKQTRKAWRLVDGTEVEVHVSELHIGDHIVVRAGDQIPVDGVVIDGDGMVDQHAPNGESVPAEKTAGDGVFAMTMVMAGTVTVRVERVGENTNAAKIVRVIEHAMEHKVKLQSSGEKFADIMVLPTLGLAAAGYMVGGASSAMGIINSDFGTGIRMAAPIALMAVLAQAAQHAIIIKNSSILENLSDMDAVIFDKTGTLTNEVPEVGRVFSSDARFTEDDVLAYVAGAESKFTHPIARAIVEEAEARGLALPLIDDSSCHIGYGVEAEVDRGNLKVGSLRY